MSKQSPHPDADYQDPSRSWSTDHCHSWPYRRQKQLLSFVKPHGGKRCCSQRPPEQSGTGEVYITRHPERDFKHMRTASTDVNHQSVQIIGRLFHECQDTACREQLSVCIRYITKTAGATLVMEDFIGFVTCTSLKGVSIAEAILSKLAEVGIDLLNVRGHCYDGVSNMAGKFNGAQTLIKERVPQAYNVHCNKCAQLKATECADNDGNSSRYSVRCSGKYLIQM